MFYGRLKRLNGAALIEVTSRNRFLTTIFWFGIVDVLYFHFQAEAPSNHFYALSTYKMCVFHLDIIGSIDLPLSV